MTRVERAEQETVLRRLRRDAGYLAAHFDLGLRALDAEQPRVKRRYGICYEDGSIRIRLCHARTGRLLKYSALVDTLCHELAHLKHFNHGARFKVFYGRLLEHARRVGIYRPAPRGRTAPPAPAPLRVAARVAPARPGPVQLELF
jgi:predicted metal-dependent hydrolase